MADPLQTTALNALAPFLALAPSATSPRAAADVVSQALAAPGTFVFAELLQAPRIVALREAEVQYRQWYNALQLFCWGTWSEYESRRKSTPTDLPALSDAQSRKLRLLTLLTLSHTPSSLSYASLCSALSLDEAFLEPLLVHAISAGLLAARLNPAAQSLEVRSVAPLRDVAPGEAATLVALLEAWAGRCAGALADVETRQKAVRAAAAERGQRDEEWKAMWEEKMGLPDVNDEKVAAGAGGSGSGAAGGSAASGSKRAADDGGGDLKRGTTGRLAAAAGRKVGALLS